MTDRIDDVWGERTPHARGTVWPARVDQHLEEGITESDVDRWVPSACVSCNNGCGCDIAVKDGRMVGVRGRATDVGNHGRLGPQGLYGSTPWASSSDRLTRPLVRAAGHLVETDWETAMGRVVEVSVLHPRCDRQGRARHAPHGRQHPAVHGHQRMTVWDPVSKQPYFKTSACRVVKVRDGDGPAPAPTTAASAPAQAGSVPATRGGPPTSSQVLAQTPTYPNDPACGTAHEAPTTTIAGPV